MSVGFRPPEPPRDTLPKQLRVLWRMRGPQRVVAAGFFEHPSGIELRVYFEPLEQDELLQSEVRRTNIETLESKAEMLRDILRDKGWWPCKET